MWFTSPVWHGKSRSPSAEAGGPALLVCCEEKGFCLPFDIPATVESALDDSDHGSVHSEMTLLGWRQIRAQSAGKSLVVGDNLLSSAEIRPLCRIRILQTAEQDERRPRPKLGTPLSHSVFGLVTLRLRTRFLTGLFVSKSCTTPARADWLRQSVGLDS